MPEEQPAYYAFIIHPDWDKYVIETAPSEEGISQAVGKALSVHPRDILEDVDVYVIKGNLVSVKIKDNALVVSLDDHKYVIEE